MSYQKKKILVIDDDENLLAATRELLKTEGYDVFTHKAAFGATSVIDAVKPDLVLLDINMPGLAGDRLAYLLRSNEMTKDAPIIFYSSDGEDTLRRAVSVNKVRGYIPKGNFFELRKKIQRYLFTSC